MDVLDLLATLALARMNANEHFGKIVLLLGD